MLVRTIEAVARDEELYFFWHRIENLCNVIVCRNFIDQTQRRTNFARGSGGRSIRQCLSSSVQGSSKEAADFFIPNRAEAACACRRSNGNLAIDLLFELIFVVFFR